MFIRSCFRKGVAILSFDDGVQIDTIPNMHANAILEIIMMYDRDKKE